jgi:hypothetical protein
LICDLHQTSLRTSDEAKIRSFEADHWGCADMEDDA